MVQSREAVLLQRQEKVGEELRHDPLSKASERIGEQIAYVNEEKEICVFIRYP